MNKLKLKIPEAQKQQLYQAIVTLYTVALGIVLTLGSQFLSDGFGLPAADPVSDPLLGLGTTHFTDIAADSFTGAVTGAVTGNVTGNVTGDLTGNVTSAINSENIGVPTVISSDIAFGTLTGTIATVGADEVWLVHSVFISVTTDFDATGDAALIVGDGDDTDGFIVLADAELQVADTEGTGFAPGWQGMTAATLGAYLDLNHNVFIYDGAETIDYTISGTSLSAGAATVYVWYTRIQ